MEDHLNEMAATLVAPVFLHAVQSIRALGGVGGINVIELDVAARLLNAGNDLLDLLHIRSPIKMHTEYVQPRARQREAGCGAESTR